MRWQKRSGLGDLHLVSTASSLFDVDIHRIPARKAEPAHEHFDVRFAFVARTRDFARTEEVADVRWVPLGEVAEITSDISVLRAVRKLQALLRSCVAHFGAPQPMGWVPTAMSST